MALLDAPHNLYIVGIKGVGMTALAQVLAARGHVVSGSDVPKIFFTDGVLRAHGIPVKQGFDAANLPPKTDAVIFSTAYQLTHPEIAEARRRKIPIYTYAEMLRELFRSAEGIAVAGSHGKTTTTAMLGSILAGAGEDPTVIVGSKIPDFGGNARIGKSNLLVVETDEYQDKLALYDPKHLILTNVDYDHPDFFPTREAYIAAFDRFLRRIPADGVVVSNADDPISVKLMQELGRPFFRFGVSEQADVRLLRHEWKDEKERVELHCAGITETLALRMPGRHNALNVCAATALALQRGIPFATIRGALETFSGVERRFQFLGNFRGIPVFDDYAHHPAEISAALAAARERFPTQRLVVVFQPHTYSRTKALLSDFAQSLRADEVILLEVYASAREQEAPVSSKDIQALLPNDVPSHVFMTLEAVTEYLRGTLAPNDVLCLLGAGDTWRIASLLPVTA